ncbi:unnamed protein product [Brachionus calyciflorus]|uniref:Uncharacterized protein n=1 Tax=Brachionus calyciflorus TaxID=104777 RepID=A0A814CYY9_9BILA|nr:unnamed protein product [Brachionus calyciflorus]
MDTEKISEIAERIDENVNEKMKLSNLHDLETKMHKDPLDEANKYLCKKDVYELFKYLTANLVLKKPKDPIGSLIEQLKEIEQSEQKK